MQKLSAFVLTHNYTWIFHINLQNKKIQNIQKRKTAGIKITIIAKEVLLVGEQSDTKPCTLNIHAQKRLLLNEFN